MAQVRRKAKRSDIAARKRGFWPILLLFAALLLAGGAAGAWYWLIPLPAPHLNIDLTGVDPDVAHAIDDARVQTVNRRGSADAWGHLGEVLFAHDYFTPAKDSLVHAEKLNPKDARWPYFQGLIQSGSDPEDSVACFRRAHEREPNNRTIETRLAEQLLAGGQLHDAAEHFRKVLSSEPDNPRACLGLGMALLRQDDVKGSVPYLNKAAFHPASRRAANVALAAAYRRLGDAGAARDAGQLAARLPADAAWDDPYNAELDSLRRGLRVSLSSAAEMLKRGQATTAVALLQRETATHPDSDLLARTLGRAYLESGNAKAAERTLRQLLDRKPDDHAATFLLAGALHGQKDYAGAVEWFRKTVALKPDSPLAYYNLGQCLLELHDRAGALDAFRTALHYRPDLVQAHTAAAGLLNENGQAAEAREHIRQALLIAPDDARVKAIEKKLSGGP